MARFQLIVSNIYGARQLLTFNKGLLRRCYLYMWSKYIAFACIIICLFTFTLFSQFLYWDLHIFDGMSILQRFILVLFLTSTSYAGVIEKRQAVETFATCTVK